MNCTFPRRNLLCRRTTSAQPAVGQRRAPSARRGLTLPELLVSMTVTAIVVSALAVFTKAVMDGCDSVSKTGNTTQAGRVVTARIAHEVATSRQVLKMSDTLRGMPQMDQVLLVWDHDGQPGDTAPGQANWVELVIYASNKKLPTQLLELRPQVDPSLIVPLNDPTLLYAWIDQFRNGQNIVQPPVILFNDLGGIHFDVDETTDPQGIGGLVQQNVRIVLCVSPTGQDPAVFFGSATRRYVTGN